MLYGVNCIWSKPSVQTDGLSSEGMSAGDSSQSRAASGGASDVSAAVCSISAKYVWVYFFERT